MSGYRRFLLMSVPLAILSGILPHDASAGGILRVPLNLELDGSGIYYVAHPDSLAFDAERPLPDITAVRLHLTGTACCHLTFGGMVGEAPSGSHCEDPGLEFGFIVDGAMVYPTVYTIPGIFDNSDRFATCEDQAVDVEVPFLTGPGSPAWLFLSGGTGTVFLKGFDPPSCFYPYYCFGEESLVLTAAELVVEIPDPTPVEERCWGTIKAIYR